MAGGNCWYGGHCHFSHSVESNGQAQKTANHTRDEHTDAQSRVKTVEELQEAAWEINLEEEVTEWLDKTAWKESKTARSGHRCWVNLDSGEVVLALPTSTQKQQAVERAIGVRRAGKVLAAGDKNKSQILAQRLGLSIQELAAENESLERTERHRRGLHVIVTP